MELRLYVALFVYFMCTLMCVSGEQLEFNGYKISVPRHDNIGLSRPDGQMINVTVLGLYEKDQHGNMISTEGHSLLLADHPTQNFTVRETCTAMVQSSNTRARLLDVQNAVDSDAQTVGISYGLYMMTSGGSLIRGEKELQHVDVNNVKLTLTIDGWRWCAPCQGTDGDSMTGAFLDVIVRLQLPANAQVHENPVHYGPREINLGNRMILYFSKQVMEDGVWQETNANYPKVSPTTDPRVHDVTIRMSKFDQSAMYDPVFSLDQDDKEAPVEGDPPPECTKDNQGGSGPTAGGATLYNILLSNLVIPVILVINL